MGTINEYKICTTRTLNMSGRYYKTSENLLPVEKPHAGGTYHVSWAKKGCVWNCSKVNDNGTVDLITPTTRKKITVKTIDLRHTRKTQKKIEKI